MNATRTTLSEALWRWQRGIARALLLMGALAGMSLGTVAHAQITFKDKSFAAALAAPAAPTASPGTTSAITFVGEARMPTTADTGAAATSATITPPGSMAADDFVVVYVAVRDAGTAVTITNSTTGGQTWTAPVVTQRQNNVNFRIFHAKFNGTWSANPAFSWGTSLPHQVWMVVFRGVDTTTPIVAGPSVAAFPNIVADVTITAGTITTGTVTNAMVVASWHSNDNNAWALQTAGWLNPNTQTHWRTTAGSDSSSSIGYKVQAAAGGNEAVTNQQTQFGPDSGIRSILALRPATNLLTITQPTGTVSGDVLVASIGFRPFCCNTPAANYGITPLDAGWTLLRRVDNVTPPPIPPDTTVTPSHSLAVYWKVAGASEPAAYRWSFSASGGATFDAAAGGILKFLGAEVEAVAPIIGVEENGQPTSNGTSHATPSITTPAVNTMLIASYGISNPADLWTMIDTSLPWTKAFTPDPTGGSETFGMFWGVKPVAGATGTIQANSAVADVGNAHILALRSVKSGTALTIPIPPSTVAGDVMIASIAVRASSSTACPCPQIAIGAPVGWDLVRETPRENIASVISRQAFYVRVADASDTPGSSYTWTLDAANTGAVGGILSFSGVDTTAPIVTNAIDNHGGNLSESATPAAPAGTIRANAINTIAADTVAVSAHSMTSSVNWTPAADKDVDVASRRVLNTVGISLAMYHYPAQAIPGATGNKDATATGDTDTGIAEILALKPIPTVVTPGSFNAFETSTAAGAITGVIRTKVAGSAFSLDVVAIASGAQQAGFTDAVIVELLGNNTLGVALDAQNCPTSFTLVQTVAPNPTITGGRSTVSLASVANSWRDVRVRVRWPTSLPTVTWCSTDNFAIRPANFSVAVTDTTWATAGTPRALNNVAASGGNVHKAGQPFTITVTPSPGTATNYAESPTVSALACTLPATCANGTLTVGTFGGSGTRVSNDATYTEAGAFNLTLIDQTFASVDSADGTPADCSAAGQYVCHSGAPLAVGRFVPDRFAVTAVTPPVFRTFDAADAACTTPPSGPVRSFTYIGQFSGYQTSPVAMITAQNTSGGTTTNYRSALWKLTGASASQTFANSPVETLDTTQILVPTVTETPNTGTGTLTANAADKLAFMRNNASPRAPFNANLSLTVSVSDAAEAGANQGTITTTTPLVFNGGGSGIAFDSGAAFRYGRLRLGNANGSQLVPLPVPVETQYFVSASSNFVTNAADNCTTIATNNVAMSNFTNNLAACETAITAVSGFSSGRSTLTLAAPGSANNGSVDLTVNLGASASGNTCTAVGAGPGPLTTTANLPYLQGNWTGGAYNVNPSARATFGVFKGAEEVIFQRENF